MKTLLLLSVLMVSACGMQGDLYLPEEGPEDGVNKVSTEISSKNMIQKT